MLSETTRRILGLIAEGRSYAQILQQHPELTYFDIFAAAREALELAVSPVAESASERTGRLSKNEIVERARAKHPRAYERWTPDEDQRLTLLFNEGLSPREIAHTLERQRGAINSRLLKLGLIVRPDDREPAALRPVDRSGAGEGAADAPLSGPVVPGWDQFRQRLSDEPDTT